MAPNISAPRRSARLQQKRHEAYIRAPHQPGRVPELSTSVPRISSFHPDHRRRQRTPGKPAKKEPLRKRKREEPPIDRDKEESIQQPLFDEIPPHKKPRQEHRQTTDPVAHWASCGLWPPGFAEMPPKQSDGFTKRKRGSSYTSDYQSGEVPKAHSAASVDLLNLSGIVLENTSATQRISEEERKTCDEMLETSHDFVPSTSFPMSKLAPVLERLSVRGESRVVRDLSPLLVPSPEGLYFSGYIESDGILEEIGADWKEVTTMGGPMPRPDFTIGFGRSVFEDGELKKLQNYKSSNRATLFTNWVYFPFLICEVKSSEASLSRAARQSAHAGSIAAKAIFELFLSTGFEKAKSLSGKILAFSIVHDHESARIFGHFPYLENGENKPKFYRYAIHEAIFGRNPAERIKKIRDFVLEIYTTWYSSHLARIKNAIEDMPMPEEPTEGQLRDSESMPPPTTSASQMNAEQVNSLTSELAAMTTRVAAMTTQLADVTALFKTQLEEAERMRTQLEEKERIWQAEREEAEKARQAEKEEAEKIRQAEKEEAQKRWDDQQGLINKLIGTVTERRG